MLYGTGRLVCGKKKKKKKKRRSERECERKERVREREREKPLSPPLKNETAEWFRCVARGNEGERGREQEKLQLFPTQLR